MSHLLLLLPLWQRKILNKDFIVFSVKFRTRVKELIWWRHFHRWEANRSHFLRLKKNFKKVFEKNKFFNQKFLFYPIVFFIFNQWKFVNKKYFFPRLFRQFFCAKLRLTLFWSFVWYINTKNRAWKKKKDLAYVSFLIKFKNLKE